MFSYYYFFYYGNQDLIIDRMVCIIRNNLHVLYRTLIKYLIINNNYFHYRQDISVYSAFLHVLCSRHTS